MLARAIVGSLLIAVLTSVAAAQIYGNGSDGAFAPIANTTLSTTANGGVFQFTSVHIPAGVTVRLTGTNPARILCQGAVTIEGALESNGEGTYVAMNGAGTFGSAGGAGGYDGARTNVIGGGPGGGITCGLYLCLGGNASHCTAGSVHFPGQQVAPTYGAPLPFDLRGGSGGGSKPSLHPGPNFPGAGGGGAVAILAEGSIVVSGRISMRGGDCEFAGNTVLNMPESGGNGSGGAILLRSLQCVHVTGVIDARGGVLYLAGHSTMYPYYAGDGLVRIDSYSACGAPDLTGATIQPAPFIAALPFVAELDRPRIGQTYRTVCASTPGDVLGFYYSLGTVMTPVPPFGVLELDPSMILPFGLHAVPTTGNDPLAVINLPIPSIVSLIGITFHAQMFNAFGAGNGLPRLSNRLVATIGN